jgi:hypothetical protein
MLQQRLNTKQTGKVKTDSCTKAEEMAINNEADLSHVEDISKDLVQVRELMPEGLRVDSVDTQNIQEEKPAQQKTKSVVGVRKWVTLLKCANLQEVEPTGSKPPGGNEETSGNLGHVHVCSSNTNVTPLDLIDVTFNCENGMPVSIMALPDTGANITTIKALHSELLTKLSSRFSSRDEFSRVETGRTERHFFVIFGNFGKRPLPNPQENDRNFCKKTHKKFGKNSIF